MSIVHDYREINKRVKEIAPKFFGEKLKPCNLCGDVGWVAAGSRPPKAITCPECCNPHDKPNPLKMSIK